MRIGQVKRAFILVPFVFLFFSCSTAYQTVKIETPVPGSEMLPSGIRSLTLINRAVTSDFRNFNTDSLQLFFARHGYHIDGMVLDSMAADTTLKVLARLLYESGRYDVVIPKKRFLQHETKFYQIDSPLSWDTVKAICTEFNTDALLVLERYMDHLETRAYKLPQTLENPSFYRATVDSRYDILAKIYDPSTEKIVRQILVKDTISWNHAAYQVNNLLNNMPHVKEMLIQTGIQAAIDASQRLSPSWKQDQRGYFLLTKQDTVVHTLALSNDWQKVYDYWATRLKQISGRVSKSKVLYNLAVASEMTGNVEQALQLVNQSLALNFLNQAELYHQRLEERQKQLRQFNSSEN